MNKQEKAQRKAWKKQAQRMAGHDLDGLIALNKQLFASRKFWKRIAITSLVVTGLCIAVGIAAAIYIWGMV